MPLCAVFVCVCAYGGGGGRAFACNGLCAVRDVKHQLPLCPAGVLAVNADLSWS